MPNQTDDGSALTPDVKDVLYLDELNSLDDNGLDTRDDLDDLVVVDSWGWPDWGTPVEPVDDEALFRGVIDIPAYVSKHTDKTK